MEPRPVIGRRALVIDRVSLAGFSTTRDRTFRSASIVLQLPQLTRAETDAWQARLEHLHNECGCGAGAAALVGAVAVLLPVLWLRWSLSGARLSDVGWALLIVVASAGLGKLVGLRRARSRFQKATAELLGLVDERTG